MLTRILFLLLVTCTAVSAAETVPSEASIRELLTIMDAKKMVDSMMGQMNGMMQGTMREALKGQQLSAEEQKMIQNSMTEMQGSMSEVLSWSKLEPMYIRIYQRSLTQEEVSGMITFYKTPVGEAMIHKMPVIIQNTMQEVQAMVAPMMQSVQQSQQRLLAQLKAERKKKLAK
ncbi:MAG: DUF2059 domain-containing protein [Chthoniobacterales bacterium]